MAMPTPTPTPPLVLNDPRFLAGRELVKRGLSDEGGVEIFGTLLEELNVKYGSSSGAGAIGASGGTAGGITAAADSSNSSSSNNNNNIECAPAYYEYGNALHYAALSRRERQQQQQQSQEDINEDDQTENEKKLSAAAVTSSSSVSVADQPREGGKVKDDDDDANDDDVVDDDDDDDDLQLALEMMESAFSILQLYEEDANAAMATTGNNNNKSSSSRGDNSDNDNRTKYLPWVVDQIPRVLMGIGDVLSSLGRFPDATDVYTRALERRKEQLELEKMKGRPTTTTTASTATATATTTGSMIKPVQSLELLKSYRLVCEAAVATAQALLDCPPDEDVVTTETKSLLVPKDERISYVEGYYWQARDALQEVLLTLAELEGKSGGGQNQQTEQSTTPGAAAGEVPVVVDKTMKEDVSHIAILVMGLGEALAEAKEEVKQEKGPSSPGPDDDGREPQKKRSKR